MRFHVVYTDRKNNQKNYYPEYTFTLQSNRMTHWNYVCIDLKSNLEGYLIQQSIASATSTFMIQYIQIKKGSGDAFVDDVWIGKLTLTGKFINASSHVTFIWKGGGGGVSHFASVGAQSEIRNFIHKCHGLFEERLKNITHI